DWWQRPDQARHERLQQGAQAYRGGDYAAAAQAWDGLDVPDAHYNRGNALARQGRFAEAIAAYGRALELQPGMEDALANREVVQAAMDRQPDGGGAPQDQGEGPPKSCEDGDGDDRDQGDAGEPPPGGEAGQEAADQAQRERMEQALEDRPDSGEPQPAVAEQAPETPQERERRIANEAWLRRVPDDPGGLLREKFRIEHERRRLHGGRED
ncbi:tetratricopeptide repeat protein, partial [Bacillus tequilensis]|nr:tetratricopeptide repeat protein [Bacillus tequilensis]